MKISDIFTPALWLLEILDVGTTTGIILFVCLFCCVVLCCGWTLDCLGLGCLGAGGETAMRTVPSCQDHRASLD